MQYKDFGRITEEEILKNCPRVIADVKNEFNLIYDRTSSPLESGGNSESRGYARVLTKDSSNISNPSPVFESNNSMGNYNMGGYSINSDVRQNNGASYVLVVAAIIALIILVYVVATTILNMVNSVY